MSFITVVRRKSETSTAESSATETAQVADKPRSRRQATAPIAVEVELPDESVAEAVIPTPGDEVQVQLDIEADARFNIAQEPLLNALRTAASAVLRDDSIPVLKHLLVEVDEKHGCIAVSGYNLKVCTRVEIGGASINSGGRFLVAPTRLVGYLAQVPEGNVQVAVNDAGKMLKLTQPGIEFEERVSSAKDYPEFKADSPESDLQFWLDSAELRRGLESVRFAVSEDEKRPVLCCVLLQIWGEGEEASFTLAATNSKTLAVYDLKPDEGEAPSAQVLIPRDALAAIIGTTYRGERLCCSVLESFIRFQTSWRDSEHDEQDSTITVDVRMVDGTFPGFRTLIPQAPTSSIAVDWQQLAEALARQKQAMAETKGGTVSFRIEPDVLTISSAVNGKTTNEKISGDNSRTGEIALPLGVLVEMVKVAGSTVRLALDYVAPNSKTAMGEVEENRALWEFIGSPFSVVMMKVSQAAPAVEAKKQGGKGRGKAK